MRNKWTTVCLLALITATLPARGSEVWWGLWNTGLGLEQRSLLYSGTNNMYVRLTAQNSPLLVGGQIHGMRFYVGDKTAVSAARVWVSASVGGDPLLSVDVNIADIRDMAHDGVPTEIRFSQPLSVLPAANPYASFYAGFTLELQDAPLTYLLAGRGKGTAFSNYYNGLDVAANYGAVALQVLASGPKMEANAATPQGVGEQIVVAGDEATVSVPVVNQSSEPLSSVSYVVSVDGQPQAERTYELPLPLTELGLQFDVPMHYAVPPSAEEHKLDVAITKVNGHDNASTAQQQTANLIVLAHEAEKRTVMEEFTGTWCQNCIRGFVGIELLEQLYGNRFMAIAMHSDDPVLDRDPMTVSHYRNSTFYKTKSSKLGGLPACTIDRWIDGDPYCGYNTTGAFQTDALVAEALSRKAVADVELTATWADEGQTLIRYDVTTDFKYQADDAHYRLILVLTADGLRGEDNRWRQINGYDDYAGPDEALLKYAGRGYYLTDMVYNHVAADIVGVNEGIEGSIASPLTVGTPQHFAYQLDIAGNTIIQDKQQLNAIAMLVDTRDGSVVNAAKAHVDGASAISATTATRTRPGAVYDLTGRRVTPPASHGVYIADGKKILK